MAPAIPTTADTILSALGPLAANSLLTETTRLTTRDVPGGVIPPTKINNNAIFALFGLIGVAFVVLGIWFFFWAKNGGFVFKDNDWDDYKTTVLRRRGPNGTLLSGATESTRLGGGSVYKDVDDGSSEATPTVVTAMTESTAMTGITAGVSDIGAREKRRKKKEQREREKERRREEKAREKEEYRRRKAGKRKVGEDGLLVDEEAEAEAKAQLRNYRHEKPARVGGLNKESEASEWDGSTNPSNSTMSQSQSGHGYGSEVTSELIQNRERTPTSTPTKKAGGIRKVYSTAEKAEDRERERLRAEARKLQEKGRAARAGEGASRESRRDFSYKQGDDAAAPLRTIEEASDRSGRSGRSRSRHRAARDEVESRVPGSWAESDVGSSDVGTKVYKHSVHIPIPSAAASSVSGTSTSDFAYQEEKRKRRQGAGYRRNRDG
ncbi:hypothetical protein CONLIGDRAFT_631731 [Coniochaeta ligniaria NRRL 30616]|uniref:Endosomal spry domain-containing protein n=1 Tax=Coniochaeta ligniaria NRRL 30616 TaxID=1408157 RepID=A0A1J7IQ88_9PEZI|nr:hypothetical protein CONLIGDRAFT_631731 [Coniochaeta ligniaria NRRL 30616]